jgi:membrane glycosyltransferase
MPRAPLTCRAPDRQGRRTPLPRLGTAVGRLYALAVALVIGGYAACKVVSSVQPVLLQWLFLGLFLVNFLWISVALTRASLGFLCLLARCSGPMRVGLCGRLTLTLGVIVEMLLSALYAR